MKGAAPLQTAAGGGLREWWPVLLIWSALLALPFARSVELPILIMALLGARALVKQGRALAWSGGGRVFTLLFVLLWLPMLLSIPAAVHLDKTLLGVLSYVRFYLAGLFVLQVMAAAPARERLLRLSAALLLFWLFDALVQLLFHRDLFGYDYLPGRLNALFGEDSKRFGYVLAVLSPLLLEFARLHWPRWAQAAAALTVLVAVLLAGSRAAWIMLFVVFCGYFLLYVRERPLKAWRWAGAGLAGGLAVVLAAYVLYPPFTARMDTSLLVLKGDAESIDTAISLRLPIWQVALAMYADHPVTGVGVHGFRYAYPEYAQPGDPFVHINDGTGALHSHHLWLEVAAETGSVGLAGLAVAMILLLLRWWQAPWPARRMALPWALVLLALLFPLNTHVPAYSLLMAVLLWLPAALYCAACADVTARPGRADASAAAVQRAAAVSDARSATSG